MKIAVFKETRNAETRVAVTPDTIKKLAGAGHEIRVEAGAGLAADFPDEAFREAGASIAETAQQAAAGVDAVFCVRLPEGGSLAAIPDNAALIGLVAPHDNGEEIRQLAARGVEVFACEFTPRITRAQSMDALSSQANLAGYRAVLEAAHAYGRAFPMMMTAAGTIAPARVFVMGAGVAGLQAIATAKRLGAQVSATDVRPAAKEQVASLGGKFVAVEDEEFKEAETAGGYAKEMSDEYKAKQAKLVAEHITKQDVVITTALIPGRPAPRLIDAEMVASMKPGSVLVDLAVERGGNIEGAELDRIAQKDGKSIIGYANLPGRLPADASSLYAKNLLAFLPLVTAEDGAYAPDWDDEIVAGMVLTKGGEAVHDAVKG
ncbi:Re/Si-specific NAD(P)(+) transhydrogenase subunit alpha [Euryhalocaulis caribicus]|uniref:Re/Si-specific NAD(P)(+) transhydrogenase subunit alpha n=1 Tax=Euryhalocaulis caribicus TaxID=1161401 RepID=UPI0003A45A75|nr:Re/Si-specific NAD(P)(+) transhydrogenase subunit alpha [Euryhalocaulis caribicus]